MAKTPNRTIRIPDRIWNRAKHKSKRTGIPITRVISAALHRWAKDEPIGEE